MIAGRLLNRVLDFCYPGSCAACERPCDGGMMLCAKCGGALKAIEAAPACPGCAMPLPEEGSPCPYCKGGGIHPIDRIVRLGLFNDPLKDLIHKMKYQRRWLLAEQLADELAESADAKSLIGEESILVPVPLHFLRHLRRGYNQSEILARRLARKRKAHVVIAAKRTRNTPAQVHIRAHADRYANVRNAFALTRGRRIHGRHVVLVDDVMTTGATLRSLARTLLPAEPKSISAIVLAIADPKGRDFQAI